MEILFDRIEGEETLDFVMVPCESCGTTADISGPSPGCRDPEGCGTFLLESEEELD